MSEVERITIEEIIKYVKELCEIREEKKEEEKENLSFNEVVINLPLLLSIFSALIPKYKDLSLEDKTFYLKKYIIVFSTELKKKNIYIKYTTETNIIDKKIIMKDIKSYENIEDFNNLLIFLTLFFNINIFIIEDEEIKLFTSNYFFNVFKYSIILKKITKINYNIIKFKDETLFSYIKNDEFKSFIDFNMKKIKTLKQDSHLNYVLEPFNIQDDKDIKHYENSNSSILEINKTRVYKNNPKSSCNTEKEIIDEKKDMEKIDDSETKKEKEISTEKINQIVDLSFTYEDLKKMNLIQLKSLTKQNKLKITNSQTKKPFSKGELIQNLLDYIKG